MKRDEDQETIRFIEQLAFHAWPAAEIRPLGGWRLRFTGGVTRRANSVWPNGDADSIPLSQKLAMVETLYARHGLPACYQLCPASQPSDLDDVLTRRGYTADAHTNVQIADVTAVLGASGAAPGRSITLSEAFDEQWFRTYCQAESVDGQAEAVRRDILKRIEQRTAYVMLSMSGQPASLGLGVLQGDWVGIFNMATRREFRRQGAATAVMHSLAGWGQEHGARHIYLQVMRRNLPASTLYERLGFATRYSYHYCEASHIARPLGTLAP